MEKAAENFARKLVETLKKERLARHMSHEQLAVLSGLSRQAIGKIEAGERNPSMQNVYRLAKAMGMTMEQFVREMKVD